MNHEFMIKETLHQLFEVAHNENKDKNDIETAIGEIEIKGVEYQIQIKMVANKKLWAGENEVRFSEVTKIHDGSSDARI